MILIATIYGGIALFIGLLLDYFRRKKALASLKGSSIEMHDVVNAALLSDEPRTLSFIIAHEIAHHALGHTKYFRSQLRAAMKWLARLDEFSCDAVANEVAGDRTASAKALTLLTSGPNCFVL
ncbi:MAG TPA: hypothetical protein VGV18_08995 [Verrucomicrobiae bacterium]|nr:hypothetical protein [Verrucomicrobiae bacterium]